ncbi:TPA: hypothetical protein O4H68_003967 [Vibrio alginolyticus]|nr:hypothetical protein [Vibrio alginolyticus]
MLKVQRVPKAGDQSTFDKYRNSAQNTTSKKPFFINIPMEYLGSFTQNARIRKQS